MHGFPKEVRYHRVILKAQSWALFESSDRRQGGVETARLLWNDFGANRAATRKMQSACTRRKVDEDVSAAKLLDSV